MSKKKPIKFEIYTLHRSVMEKILALVGVGSSLTMKGMRATVLSHGLLRGNWKTVDAYLRWMDANGVLQYGMEAIDNPSLVDKEQPIRK